MLLANDRATHKLALGTYHVVIHEKGVTGT